ncbi:type III-B CRISPR module RAMP protein Cmr6 [Clostridium faecium]|nr:type III-B CRISPR module RAMP protein Cmr6 [Clostridium faecium]
MSQNKSNRSHIKNNKNIDKEDKDLIEVSKNVYRKDMKEFIFYKNLDISNFKGLRQDEFNLKYSLQKNVVRESGKKERRYLGKIKTNNEKIKGIGEIERLNPNYHQSIVEEYIYSIKEYCRELDFSVTEIEGITSYRLVVGLGNPSVTETSMTLHNIYGIPYIPGQALKGVVRSYFLQLYSNIEKNEFNKITIDNKKYDFKKMYKWIFGEDISEDDNNKGNLIFFDSFPTSKITVERDIMTPHYTDYYENGKDPIDIFEPNPISFYTVKDTKFNFMFALSKKEINISEDEFIDYKNFKSFILELIQNAFEEHGIGAKTSIGYGYFNIDKVEDSEKMNL